MRIPFHSNKINQISLGAAVMESPESSPLLLGSSLPVPNVQELTKEGVKAVPLRYVREDQEPLDSSPHSIPIIDLQILQNGGDDCSSLELKKLHFACKEWGFFQLVNHGISTSLIEKMKYETREFFKLPLEEKQELKQLPGDIEGYGQAFVVSEEQKLDWADIFYLVTLPIEQRKTHIFQKLHSSFRETLEAYGLELRKVAMVLFELMANSIGMKCEEMKELFDAGFQSMRMNYYPPCPQPELVVGLTPHSDSAALTLLLQVTEKEGLHIRKDGLWLPVKPLPNALVVNIGDMLEIVSNGIYRSIEHRAVVNSKEERISIATFYCSDIRGEIGPAPSLVSPKKPPLFKRVSVVDYFRSFFSRNLEGKSYLDSLRIVNGGDM